MIVTRGGLWARVALHFPEHEIYLRSGGRMRFVKISSALQMRIAALVLVAALGWLGFTGLALGSQLQTWHERSALGAQKQALDRSATRFEAYRESVDGLAARIERRQQTLDALVTRYFGDVAQTGEAPAAALGAAIPEAAPLARAEQRQLAFADRLATAAAARSTEAEQAIRRFGLNPAALVGARRGMGGPLFALPQDTSFDRLARSLGRLDRVEKALVAIPNAAPTSPMSLSSGFGYRADPFTGGGALHAGIDVTGAHGQAVRAAASGRVVHVGPSSGYGLLVTIDHGQGIETRYGHLSGFAVKMGDRVTRGSPIARMGNTGRSTGTHLHFEVRVHGRAINPRPFLGGNKDVLEVQNHVERRFARRA